MTSREALLFLTAMALALSALGGCMARSLPTYRYRLTVEVDTPQGLRAGSSVIEVTNGMGRGPGDSGYRFGSEARGEAVAVDLPDGQTLFALLRNEGWLNADWAARIVYDLTPIPPVKEGVDHRLERLANAVANRSLIVVPPSKVVVPNERVPLYPQLVTFTDIRDPKTVVRVDPDDLAASFGPGVKLRRITVQITDDPVTTGIEKRFGWWDAYRDRHFDGTSTVSEDLMTIKLSASLSSGSFRTEFNK